MSSATPPPMVPARLFGLFCIASYLLSLSYGSTFLLSLLIGTRVATRVPTAPTQQVGWLKRLIMLP